MNQPTAALIDDLLGVAAHRLSERLLHGGLEGLPQSLVIAAAQVDGIGEVTRHLTRAYFGCVQAMAQVGQGRALGGDEQPPERFQIFRWHRPSRCICLR